MTTVAFAFANPRAQLLEEVRAGREPDTQLLGLNHLQAHGIQPSLHDPLEPEDVPVLPNRLVWTLRELPLCASVRRADAVVSPLVNVLPFLARPPLVLVNYGLNLIHRRAGGARRRALRAAVRRARRVICFGRVQAEELREWTGLSDEAVVVIPAAVDARWLTPAREQGERPLVLAVGKDLGRDYATFAAAMTHVDADAEVIAFPRNVEGVELPANVRARRVGSAELRELYARASCVVIPQHPEGYVYGAEGGLTALLDAMAMARPVVATDRQIIREYADDGVEATLVPAHEADALAGAIRDVLADRTRAEAMGTAGRRRVERAHTTELFATQLASVLYEVAVTL